MDVYNKVREIVDKVKGEFGLDENTIFVITQKLANSWHYKKKKDVELSKEEAMLYEFYINNNLNPSTFYKWMLLIKDSPREVKEKLATGQVNVHRARALVKEYKQLHNISQAEFIKVVADNVFRYLVR